MQKWLTYLGMITALVLMTAGRPALAEDGASDRTDRRARLLERYDADGDGTLSAEERDQARKDRRLKHADTNGDGQLSDEERSAAHEARKQHHQEILDKYDADADGRLSRSERQTAHADGVRVGHPHRHRGGGAPR